MPAAHGVPLVRGAEPGPALLEVKDLHAWYGESHVLHGLSMEVRAGETVALLGRNGAGKTTTLKSIMGMVERKGSVRFEGKELAGAPPEVVARAGIAICPEERGIFASLSVEENLVLPPVVKPGGFAVDALFELFPNLRERLKSPGTKLSGGEQQMLAIARILRTGARFLLLDEPNEGLAPVIVEQIRRTIERLKRDGFTIVLVEQNLRFAAAVADRHYVVERGQVVDQLTAAELAQAQGMERVRSYLGV
jgi:branched-chain amino acid transport system ATP-binding protein